MERLSCIVLGGPVQKQEPLHVEETRRASMRENWLEDGRSSREPRDRRPLEAGKGQERFILDFGPPELEGNKFLLF